MNTPNSETINTTVYNEIPKIIMPADKDYYVFGKLSPAKRKRIVNLLSYCKEIRNTAYPLPNSNVTTLQLVEFRVHKEKGVYYINGSLSLVDGERSENRCFEAYILDSKGEATIYLDVTRLCVENEPKMIRTSETFVETADTVIGVTKYACCGYLEEKVFSEEFPKQTEIVEESSKKIAPLK